MIADIIFILILLISLIVGYRRGLFQTLGRLVILAVSLALTLVMLSPFVNWLSERPLLQPLARSINEPILEPLRDGSESLGSALEKLELPQAITSLMAESMPEPDTEFSQAYPEFSAALFRFALMAAFFVLIFALISIVIHLLTRSLTRVSDHVPLLGTANRLTGMVVGLVFGLLQCLLILLLMTFLAPRFPVIRQMLSDSMIAGWVYSTELFNRIL
ncbi:MAG: CvpA family protein [Eubacteriales bacterium]|nr:CvpA family protein [Eubacteriales bacterium]